MQYKADLNAEFAKLAEKGEAHQMNFNPPLVHRLRFLSFLSFYQITLCFVFLIFSFLNILGQ